MRSKILAVLAAVAFLAFTIPEPSFARGGGGRGRGHSSGHYSGGHGSSHKGGHYKNLKTGNHYQRKGYSHRGNGAGKSSGSRHYSAPLNIHSGVQRDSHGRIERSLSAKQEFLRQHGLTHVPKGYQVDHRIPLYAGGRDDPSNMQILTTAQHHQKTKGDYQRYGR